MSENQQGDGKKTMTLEPGTHWLCTCGKSSYYPMCDGSHMGTRKGPKKLVIDEPTEISTVRPEVGE